MTQFSPMCAGTMEARLLGVCLVDSTSFLSSCGRSVAWSRGKPDTRVAVSTWGPLSSSITSGTWKNGWSSSSSLTRTQRTTVQIFNRLVDTFLIQHQH